MIENLLSQLGLNHKEIEVYLAIVRSGKVSAARVSALTGINRTTVYSVAKNLKKLGIISEDLGAPTAYFTALDPEGLKVLIEKERQSILDKEKIVKEAIDELRPLASNVKYSVPRMQFIEESNLNEHLHSQTPVWVESIKSTDGVWWGFQDHAFVEHYGEWIKWFWKENPNHDLKLLTNQTESEAEIARELPSGRKMKYWTGGQKEFDATTWVLGNFVVMIMTRERPHYMIEIHDAVLARNQRALFAGIWRELSNR